MGMDRGRGRPPGYRPGPARSPRSQRLPRSPRPTRDLNENEYENEYEYEPRPRRRRPSASPPARQYRPQPRRRRVWPVLLAGCGMGIALTVIAAAVVVFLALRSTQGGGVVPIPIIGGSAQTFTKEDTTQVQLSTISQLQICDKIGNVSINVDPTATTPNVTTTKVVHMSSQSAANQEFQRIAVEVQPPGTIANALACTKLQPTTSPTSTTGTPTTTSAGSLTINVTLPANNGLVQANSDAVNVAITLPASVLPPDGPTMNLNVEAPVGDITINGISGLMNIAGDKGNIHVSNGVITGGSRLVTNLGNIAFNGTLGSPAVATADNNFYRISSSQGNIDVTLPSTTNVTLDTYTNQGKITSDFSIPLQTSDAGMTYQGPLNPGASPAASVTLVVHMNLGNIAIHKSQV